jgi:hypothetical protein
MQLEKYPKIIQERKERILEINMVIHRSEGQFPLHPNRAK